jgi:putative endonuclease
MKTSDKTYIVYILLCKDQTLYCGITTDMERRFKEHQEGIGSQYTRVRGVSKIMYTEELLNRSEASKREAVIKKLSRKEKLKLCCPKASYKVS